jgi:excisionase family DNA binding protein
MEIPKLLTESEAAEFLRCSTAKIKRLRLKGLLPFYPGRPVLIAESDLVEYLEALKQNVKCPPTPEEKQKADIAGARQWALKAKLLKRQR